MSIIYIAHGLTASGKTETANYLESKYNIHHYHPIGFMKRFEEQLCGLPEGSLDLPNGKNAPVPTNETKSMQEYMVALYHFYKEWMPGRSSLNIRREIPKLLAYGDVCVVSIRNIEEINALIEVRNEGFHRMVALHLHRGQAKLETSDENYKTIRQLLWAKADMVFPINNNFNLDHLHRTLDDILKYCK